MPARFRFLLLYFLGWTLLFEAARLLFLLFQWKALPAGTFVGTLWYGARMDLSMAAYLSLPVSVFLLGSFFLPFFRRPLVYQVYTILVLVPVLLLVVCDVEAFRQWGFRLDATPLKYLSSPREAWASVSGLPVWRYTLLFLLLCGVAGFGAARWLRRRARPLGTARERWYIGLPALLLAMGALVIPMRGGLQQTPLNQSSVYFSANNYANQAALNVPWNVLFGVLSETAAGSETNPYHYLPDAEAKRVVDSLYQPALEDMKQWFRLPKPNVLVIVWESGTAKGLETSVNGIPVMPGLQRLTAEGIWFPHAWASGDRTDKGLPAVLSGYPALPQSSIIRLPNKARKLASLPALLHGAGYATSFYYGGELEFANIKSYLLGCGFDRLTEKADFAAKDLNSKWGAHDGAVADRLFSELGQMHTPFFSTWLTLSSHEPFETPVPTVIPGEDETHLFLNSLHYTDSVLYHFIERARTQSWWANTVVVLVADHGHPLPETGRRIDNFRIPILLLGGALRPEAIGRVEATTSQLDIAALLSQRIDAGPASFPFSKTSTAQRNWAFFSFNNGFGFVQDSNYVLFDNVGRQLLGQSAAATPQLLRAGQALQQVTYQDYLDK